MPPSDLGPAAALSSVGAVTARPVARAAGDIAIAPADAAQRTSKSSAIAVAAAPSVETTAALDPGEAPIDTERVATIRRAVESGNYPLVPAKIADAMIAAGMILRSPKP
ncbi:flagellar biosynthesis anti-sigma factor FlgM [Novosphingobium sp. 9]|uniref:flagellar biosynthesis anti-sigma factor FlgM n=1 Tax=Novosphingobium sp. 9 TaxID=2025349 RepID=UPI0021B6CC2D|nr:flagellar biosynthesis anti-sigma factor FlgM [Novosphingobium sp. 9]